VFQRETLAGGARLLCAPVPGGPSVAVFAGVAAGSRHDDPAGTGVAHLLEHLFFKGTARRPSAAAISRELTGLGADFNAFTGKEMGVFFVRCAAEWADTALDVLTDMLADATFDPAEIERERRVVRSEMDQVDDDPRERADRLFHARRFLDGPLAYPVIGDRAALDSLGRDHLVAHRERYLTPDRIVLGLAGGVSAELADRARAALSSLPSRGAPPPSAGPAPAPPPPFEAHGSAQASVVLSFPSRPVVSADRYPLAMLQTILGVGASSRLFTEVRERRGLAYYVRAEHVAYSDAGAFVVRFGCAPGGFAATLAAVGGELARVRERGVTVEDLATAQRYTIGRLRLGLEDPRGALLYGLRRELVEHDVEQPDEVVAAIRAVTPEEVAKVAAATLVPDEADLVVVGPEDPGLAADTWREALVQVPGTR
jgi:predicted Zn-dependent peptidase